MTNEEGIPIGMHTRLAALEQHVCLLDERLQYRASEQSRDFLQIQKLVDQAVDLRVNVRVLETRLAIYAGLGSLIGGAAMSLAINFITRAF